jgi:hypothetical protein
LHHACVRSGGVGLQAKACIVRLWCDGRGTMTRRADSSSRAMLRWPSRFGGRGTSTAARLGQRKPGRPTTWLQCRHTSRQQHVSTLGRTAGGGAVGAADSTPPWCCGVPFNLPRVCCVSVGARARSHT